MPSAGNQAATAAANSQSRARCGVQMPRQSPRCLSDSRRRWLSDSRTWLSVSRSWLRAVAIARTPPSSAPRRSEALENDPLHAIGRDALLAHRVAVAHRDGPVLERLD